MTEHASMCAIKDLNTMSQSFNKYIREVSSLPLKANKYIKNDGTRENHLATVVIILQRQKMQETRVRSLGQEDPLE